QDVYLVDKAYQPIKINALRYNYPEISETDFDDVGFDFAFTDTFMEILDETGSVSIPARYKDRDITLHWRRCNVESYKLDKEPKADLTLVHYPGYAALLSQESMFWRVIESTTAPKGLVSVSKAYLQVKDEDGLAGFMKWFEPLNIEPRELIGKQRINEGSAVVFRKRETAIEETMPEGALELKEDYAKELKELLAKGDFEIIEKVFFPQKAKLEQEEFKSIFPNQAQWGNKLKRMHEYVYSIREGEGRRFLFRTKRGQPQEVEFEALAKAMLEAFVATKTNGFSDELAHEAAAAVHAEHNIAHLRKTRVAYLNTALPLSLAIADTQEKELLWEGDPLEYQLLGHLEARQRVSVWASQPPEARRQEAQECGLSEVIKTNNHRRWEIADDQGRATLASKLGAGIDDVRGVFVTSQEIQEQKDNDFTAQLAALEADQQYAQALKLIGEQSEGLKQKLEAKAKTLALRAARVSLKSENAKEAESLVQKYFGTNPKEEAPRLVLSECAVAQEQYDRAWDLVKGFKGRLSDGGDVKDRREAITKAARIKMPHWLCYDQRSRLVGLARTVVERTKAQDPLGINTATEALFNEMATLDEPIRYQIFYEAHILFMNKPESDRMSWPDSLFELKRLRDAGNKKTEVSPALVLQRTAGVADNKLQQEAEAILPRFFEAVLTIYANGSDFKAKETLEPLPVDTYSRRDTHVLAKFNNTLRVAPGVLQYSKVLQLVEKSLRIIFETSLDDIRNARPNIFWLRPFTYAVAHKPSFHLMR
ncbi:MAG: hypothetical protein WCH62_08260, partial [Candidatus Omnitrophota bacterium]